MRLALFALILFESLQTGYAQFQAVQGSPERDSFQAVVELSDGSMVAAGFTSGLTDTDDILISSYSQDGEVNWTKTFGDSGNEIIEKMVVNDQDEIFFTGTSTSSILGGGSNIILGQMSSQGDLIWMKQVVSIGGDYGKNIILASNGDIILTGVSNFYSGDNTYDVTISRFNSEGEAIWTRVCGLTDYEVSASCAEDATTGNIYVWGHCNSEFTQQYDAMLFQLDSDGNLNWGKTYIGPSNELAWDIVALPEGGAVICGDTGSFGEGNTVKFAIRISDSGETIWSKTMGTSSFEHATAISLGKNNELIIAGLSNGTGGGGLDNVATFLDYNGVMKYAQAYGGDEKEVSYDLTRCADGGYVIAGYSRSYGEGFSTAYLIRVNQHGSSECIQYYSNDFAINDAPFEEGPIDIELRDTQVIYAEYELPAIDLELPISEKVCEDPYSLYTEGQQFNLDHVNDPEMPEVGIRNLSKNVYPNPTTENCFIDLKSTEDNEVQLLLFNVQGIQKWSSTQFLEAGWDYKVAIPMMGLRKGVYFLEIISSTGKVTERIVLD